eukprot:GILK01013366.1.p1 GENE.GILK01013366.1~~GILK01013366.1.p1  ORF type:complete len:434 (-),score=53.43 GILK01013366.1:39-1298(-)
MSLSARGVAVTAPLNAYNDAFFVAINNAHDPQTNPDGYAILAVAENNLNVEMLMEKLKTCREIPLSASRYGSFRGVPLFRSNIAKYVKRTICPLYEVNAESISVSAGCGSLLNGLALSLCDPGDGVIIPSPYYPAFDNDLGLIAGAVPIRAPTDENNYRISREILEQAWIDACSRNVRVRVLLISHPVNPVGITYSREELSMCLSWCTERGIHLISDEIYANSVWGEDCDKIVSLLAVTAPAPLPANAHVLWGFSKDLGLSGYRVGMLYSENAQLNRAFENLSYFSSVSNEIQYTLSNLLADVQFIDQFLAESKRSIRRNYQLITAELHSLEIPFVPANAGIFMMVDLRGLLGGSSWEDERRLWRELFEEQKLLFTPGEACHCHLPGFFRFCFAWVSLPTLQVALERFKTFVNRHRAHS